MIFFINQNWTHKLISIKNIYVIIFLLMRIHFNIKNLKLNIYIIYFYIRV